MRRLDVRPNRRRVAALILAQSGYPVPSLALPPAASGAIAQPTTQPAATGVAVTQVVLPKHLQKLQGHMSPEIQTLLKDGGASRPDLQNLVQVVLGKSPVTKIDSQKAHDPLVGALLQLARLHGPDIRVLTLPGGAGLGVGQKVEVEKLLGGHPQNGHVDFSDPDVVNQALTANRRKANRKAKRRSR